MLTRFAAGCVVAMLLTACATPLEPSTSHPPSAKAGALAAASKPADAAPEKPFDIQWPGTLKPGAHGGDATGEAHLRADVGTFFQRGIASYYGKGFHGRRTAAGEKFNMHDMTAAHPTLPLDSWVLVRNLRNDKTVVVRINDRGPYAKGRVLDLSYAAAKKLDFVRQGKAKVEIRRLSRTEIVALGLDENQDAAADVAPPQSIAATAAHAFTAP